MQNSVEGHGGAAGGSSPAPRVPTTGSMEDNQSRADPGTPPPAPRASITALLVDDEAHARTYLRLVLRELGITTVWEAGNGEEAVALFKQHQPVIVFLDHNMPLLSGRATIEQLHAIDPEVAVVVVTSDSDLKTVKAFADRGAIGYVLKHTPRPNLTRMVAEILDGFVVEGG